MSAHSKLGEFLHTGITFDPNIYDHTRLVGIEVEFENFSGGVPPLDHWNFTEDGSLRNSGVEFVSRPLENSQVEPALNEIYSQWDMHNWYTNHRTGIHVHVDARDYTVPHMRALIGLYCLLEPALFQYVGQEREECIYCVPWYRSTTDLDVLLSQWSKSFAPKDFLRRVSLDTCKYSAFALRPLGKFGTVEFRHAPTWTSKAATSQWVTMCRNLVEYAASHNLEAMLSDHEADPKGFAESILGIELPSEALYMQILLDSDCEAAVEKILSLESETLDEGWTRLTTSIKGEYPVPEKTSKIQMTKLEPESAPETLPGGGHEGDHFQHIHDYFQNLHHLHHTVSPQVHGVAISGDTVSFDEEPSPVNYWFVDVNGEAEEM